LLAQVLHRFLLGRRASRRRAALLQKLPFVIEDLRLHDPVEHPSGLSVRSRDDGHAGRILEGKGHPLRHVAFQIIPDIPDPRLDLLVLAQVEDVGLREGKESGSQHILLEDRLGVLKKVLERHGEDLVTSGLYKCTRWKSSVSRTALSFACFNPRYDIPGSTSKWFQSGSARTQVLSLSRFNPRRAPVLAQI